MSRAEDTLTGAAGTSKTAEDRSRREQSVSSGDLGPQMLAEHEPAEVHLPHHEQVSEPSSEFPPVESELFEQARAAVQAIRGRGRAADGRASAGNLLALRTGLHSAQLLQAPGVAVWHRDQVQAIETDMGGESELSSLARAHVREVARLEVIAAALGDELMTTGPLTGKGRMRAATTAYLQVLDRLVRLSAALGLARRAKPVQTLADVLAQEAARE